MQNNMEEVSGTASSLSAILQKISTDLEHESTLKEVSIRQNRVERTPSPTDIG
jgi:hypothetical protein